MSRKPEKDSGCVGCAVLLAVGALALVLWNLFHLRWWVALAVALLGPVLFLAVIETARERLKLPPAKRRRKVPEPERPPRTLAEHYLQVAARQLHDGFPLSRVSQSVPPSSCPACSKLEGRLVDLTPAQLFRDVAIPLVDLLKTGIWHEDCIHRLDYVSSLELPNTLLRRLGKDFGQEFAFGEYSQDDLAQLAALAEASQRHAEASLRHRAVSTCGKTFVCAVCNQAWPVGELSSVNGYLNAPDDLEFVCAACEAKARHKGKTHAWRPLPEV